MKFTIYIPKRVYLVCGDGENKHNWVFVHSYCINFRKIVTTHFCMCIYDSPPRRRRPLDFVYVAIYCVHVWLYRSENLVKVTTTTTTTTTVYTFFAALNKIDYIRRRFKAHMHQAHQASQHRYCCSLVNAFKFRTRLGISRCCY